MAFYESNLAVLGVVNVFLLYRQRKQQRKAFTLSDEHDPLEARNEKDGQDAVARFKREFYPAYVLVFAADWMQVRLNPEGSNCTDSLVNEMKGPHIYALYKYQKGLPERTVAALYASGFIAAAVSASFVGQLADRHGRRAACLVYCVSYSVCCLSMVSGNTIVLFVGRMAGGLSTTLLYSVFETWMITEYHQRDLESAGLTLSNIFGTMTTISSMVAIFSGIFGDALVAVTQSRVSPFLASVASLVAAFVYIAKYWSENHGDPGSGTLGAADSSAFGLKTLWADKPLISLGVVSCCFEGGMYLWIFFWSASLKNARSLAQGHDELPFGLIFSCFMCAMMLGSLLFNAAKTSHDLSSASSMLMTVTTVASCCFLLTIVLQKEKLIFWAFCLLEACVGAYFPSMALLKGQIVEDGVRGKVYGMLRLPLNIFVIVAHSLAEEGDQHRNNIFLTCGGMLFLAYLCGQRYLGR